MARGRRKKQTEAEPAEQQSEMETSPTRLSNSDARKDMIRNAHAELNRIEAEKASLQVLLKAKGKEASNVYRRLKSNLGMKREDVQLTRRLIELEIGERNETLDTIREVYEALTPGEQLDWLVATQPAEGQPDTPEARQEREARGYNDGKAARDQAMQDPDYLNGWQRGQTENVESMGQSADPLDLPPDLDRRGEAAAAE